MVVASEYLKLILIAEGLLVNIAVEWDLPAWVIYTYNVCVCGTFLKMFTLYVSGITFFHENIHLHDSISIGIILVLHKCYEISTWTAGELHSPWAI